MIALTFDDGPNNTTTISILDTLREYNSVATFFVLGDNVSLYPDATRAIIENGNEIGNHSYNHRNLNNLSPEEIEEEINNTQRVVIEATGIAPEIIRPPYGIYNESFQSEIDMPIILWSLDTEDWRYRDCETIVNSVLDNIRDGDIVLMHDIYPSSAEAIEVLVPILIQIGFQLVTVSELFEARGIVLESGKVYTRG